MDELVAFLRRCLDDDERAITAACLHIDDCNDSGIAGRFGEGRMLAEVQAKRRILDWCEGSLAEIRRAGIVTTDPLKSTPLYFAALLAQPYAGQPGWREEWQLSAGS